MMEKSTLASRSNFPTHAWPNQARGAALPNGHAEANLKQRSHSPDLIIGHRTHRGPTKRCMCHYPDHIGFLPEIQPRINTHRPRHTPTA